MSTAVQNYPARQVTPNRLLRAGVAAALAAALANLLVYIVSVAIVPAEEFAAFPLLSAPSVALSTIAGAVAATLVFALVIRLTQRPIAIFRLVAGVVALLSLGGPISTSAGITPPPMPGIEPGATVVAGPGIVMTMIVMHIVAAVIITWVLTTRVGEG